MMKRTFTALLVLLGVTCFAQVTPQYYIDRHPNNFSIPIAEASITADTTMLQNLYLRDSFTTAPPPYGLVKNIYIRSGFAGGLGDTSLWKGCKATKVLLSLGFTSRYNLDTLSRMITGLTVVASVDTLTEDTAKYGWIRIPLAENAQFFIDTTQNIVMQFAIDSGGARRIPGPLPMGSFGCLYLVSYFDISNTHTYSLSGGKSNSQLPGTAAYFYDFGIDLAPLGIDELQNVSDLRIYPNPSTDRFIISMAAKHMVKDAQLIVRDMTGRVVWQQQYQNIDDSFYQQLDMSAYPKGIYIAELRADGERVTRKLVLQ
ncbi:MAG TPA: T9SS type A sorting domain-containing protein [Flavipsychrobacter sp.]|jgi:hypothetical protein|nr:T9SS type A sorting domain-containing protein [Flavipsychrobacter sp.]